MSGRKDTLRIPSISRAPSGGDMAGIARLLSQYAQMHGAKVRVTLDGSGAAENFRHGLGRPFVGVQYWGGGSTLIQFGYADPEFMVSLGLDPSVWFRVNPSGVTSETYTFFVF